MNRYIIVRSRAVALSFQIDRRVPSALLGTALIALAAMVVSLGLGEYPISPLEVVVALLGRGSGEHDFIVNVLRLPRTLIGFLVGAALAVSGGILQGLTRNPLASPDIVGVSAGASLAAVTVTVLFPSAPVSVLPAAAFGGALVATALTYVMAWRKGSSPMRLILVGIGIAAVAQALVTVVITQGQIYRVHQATLWMTGSVYGRNWEHLLPLLPWLTVFVPVALLLSRQLNVLHFGDDVARGLGARVEAYRGLLLLTSVALAGASVATAGPVAFIGLMAPHIARRLVGPDHRGLLPTAAFVGALIVVLADLLGRTIFAPIEIPCGVITSAVGAPYFLYLLFRSRNV